MPSATRADNRLPIAASNATAIPADIRSLISVTEVCGSDGSGRDDGSDPMRATSSDAAFATIVATATAMRDAGSDRRMWGTPTMTAATRTTRPIACTLPLSNALTTDFTATAAVLSPFGFATPSAGGTCCMKMITAMPTVKPSTTGHGMNALYRPSRAKAAATKNIPARIDTTKTACVP